MAKQNVTGRAPAPPGAKWGEAEGPRAGVSDSPVQQHRRAVRQRGKVKVDDLPAARRRNGVPDGG